MPLDAQHSRRASCAARSSRTRAAARSCSCAPCRSRSTSAAAAWRNGRFWIGTPLGDVTGLAGLIERNVAQLTAAGGNVTLQAGGSIVVQKGATIDVSGGFFQHEGGMVKTTRLLQDGRLVEIHNACRTRSTTASTPALST